MSMRVFVDEPDFLLHELLGCSLRSPEFDLAWREGSTEVAVPSPVFVDVALCGGVVSDIATVEGLRELRRQNVNLPILAHVAPPTARDICRLLLADLQGYVPHFTNRARLHQSLRIAATRQAIWAATDVRAALRFVSELSAERLEQLCALTVGDHSTGWSESRTSALRIVRECARCAVSIEERAAVMRLSLTLDAPLQAIELTARGASA